MNEEYKTESGQDREAKNGESYTETNQFAVNIGKKSSGKKKLGLLAIIGAVLLLLAVGLGIYNKPENRLARQLDLGERYLEEQNYVEAVLAFEKAIQIDERCMAAYVNGIEAYRHLDEPENLLAFYGTALGIARSLEGESLAVNLDAVVSIYLAAEDIYTDREALIALWEEGYEKSGQDGRVRNELVRAYLKRAKELASGGAYEEGLQDYDRLLEMDGQNETVLESLTGSLQSYLSLLLEEENFERVRELAEKYASALPDFNFAFYLDEADRLEQERQTEELRSQLELPFTAEDITLFGYKLTEDHFDDIISIFNLPRINSDVTEGSWSKIADDGSYSVSANRWGNGFKSIDVGILKTANSFEVGFSYTVKDDGYVQFIIYDNGLKWLQGHYAEGHNLPLISCLDGKIDDWYQSIPADKIKEIGIYDSYETDYGDEKVDNWAWVIKEPVEVSYHENKYKNDFLRSEVSYKYPDSIFSMEVGVKTDGTISEMWYVWAPK